MNLRPRLEPQLCKPVLIFTPKLSEAWVDLTCLTVTVFLSVSESVDQTRRIRLLAYLLTYLPIMSCVMRSHLQTSRVCAAEWYQVGALLAEH